MNNGSRRIGALIPPGNVTVEREFAYFAPAGVYVHYNRLYRPTVSVDKAGFNVSKNPGLSVSLNQRTTTDVTLQIGTTSTTVEVTAGSAETIDLATTTIGANLSEDLYKNVPVGRNISSVIAMAPKVTRTARPVTPSPAADGVPRAARGAGPGRCAHRCAGRPAR